LKSLKSGYINATPNAKEWVVNTSDYSFSDPLITVKDVLFSRKESPLKFKQFKDLCGIKIGTHLGFNYPALDPLFSNKCISKTVSNSGLSMLNATLNFRNDASVLTSRVGKWLIKNNKHLHRQLTFSEKAVSSYDYRLMFTKDWKPFVILFNQELKMMKKNGELEKILANYK
jgi:polar amino acid transport system substrate-binding protein